MSATIGDREFSTLCLLDTGSAVSILPSNFVSQELEPCVADFHLRTATGEQVKVYGKISCNVSFRTGGDVTVNLEQSFVVADVATGPLLGSDFLRFHSIDICFANNVLSYAGREFPLHFEHSSGVYSVKLLDDLCFKPDQSEIIVRAGITDTKGQSVSLSANALFSPSQTLSRDLGILPASALVDASSPVIPVRLLCTRPHAKLRKGKILGSIENSVDVDRLAYIAEDVCGDQNVPVRTSINLSESPLGQNEREELCSLLDQYSDVFSKGESDLGRTSKARHKIPTGDAAPSCQRNYRQPYHLKRETQRQVDLLLQQGVVEPSSSPWSSPVLMVPKKDGSYRFCVDFRKLNAVTKGTEFPIPRVDECLESLGGSVLFSTLDLAAGYWQVEVDEADREKTAFSTTEGHYQFVTMPMGLKGAPATFQHLMNMVLKGLHWSCILVYLDDIIIFARSFQEHQQRLKTVLDRLREAGLKLKPSKCHFARKSVKFLGHVVSSEGVHTDPDKTKKIADWPSPQSVEEVRSFIGLASYYRRFIQDFASLAAPLTNLTGKRATFHWSAEEEMAFSSLKQRLCSSPILAYPLFDRDHSFVLKTDASGVGIGAILTQVQEGGEKVIAYGSRKLSKAEQCYGVSEREALAVVWGVTHFRPFLYGQRFTIVTDHQPLTFLRTVKDPKGRLARWIQELSAYEFDVRYKPGKKHSDADALSRRPSEVPADSNASFDRPSAFVAATTIIDNGDELRQGQQADNILKTVMQQLPLGRPHYRGKWTKGPLAGFRRIWHQLKVVNGLLVRACEGQEKLVVPKSLMKTALESCHDEASSGHQGVSKTFDRIRERFYWPGYAKAVERYVKSCVTCQQRVGEVPKATAPLHPITVGDPFGMVAVDFLELPRSSRGNKYCMVVSDYYTKWPEVVALPDQQALTVARALVSEVISRHGVPRVLHSDQGGSFENKVIRELCRILGTKKVRTTPYHPQSDGLVERLNRTFLNILSKYVDKDPSDWDLWLDIAAFAYRTAKHSSTGFTPFELLYGRNATLPIDLQVQLPRTTRMKPAAEYLNDLQCRHCLARELVEEKVAFSQNRQVTNHPSAQQRTYTAGDSVWLHDPAIRHGPEYKLRRPWVGPYSIVEVVGPVTYRIKRDQGGRSMVVHYNRLKPAQHRTDESSSGTTHELSRAMSSVSSSAKSSASPSPTSNVLDNHSSCESMSVPSSRSHSPALNNTPVLSSDKVSDSDGSMADDESSSIEDSSDKTSIAARRSSRTRKTPRWLSAYHV